MDAILQTTFSNAFSWQKLFEFRLNFMWSLFLRVQLLIFHHSFRQWPDAGQATSHCLNQRWLVYWRIYASLGLNELRVKASSALMGCDNCSHTLNVWQLHDSSIWHRIKLSGTWWSNILDDKILCDTYTMGVQEKYGFHKCFCLCVA